MLPRLKTTPFVKMSSDTYYRKLSHLTQLELEFFMKLVRTSLRKMKSIKSDLMTPTSSYCLAVLRMQLLIMLMAPYSRAMEALIKQ